MSQFTLQNSPAPLKPFPFGLKIIMCIFPGAGEYEAPATAPLTIPTTTSASVCGGVVLLTVTPVGRVIVTSYPAMTVGAGIVPVTAVESVRTAVIGCGGVPPPPPPPLQAERVVSARTNISKLGSDIFFM